MALVNQPPILASSFAVNGDKNTIPTTNSGTEGLASLSLGFPPITQQPVSQGGIPPQRADFNGIFNLITNFLMFIQNGSIFAYSSSLDYQPPAIVYGNNALYRCIATNGANTSAGVQPLSNTSYWQPLIPVGGITVSGNTITVTNETGTQIRYTIDIITNPPSQSDSSNKIVTSAWVKAYAPSKTGSGASGTWNITATKATQDSDGNAINTTYIKSITASNATLTVTKGNGTTSTVTINNVAHSTSADSAIEAGNINKGFQVNEEDFHISDFRQTILGRANNGICARPFCGKLPNNTSVSSPGIAFGGIDTHGFIQMAYGTSNIYVGAGNANKINWYKRLAITDSPAFSGTPTAPTPGVDTNNTQLATCGFVRNAIAKYAPMLDTLKKVYPVGSIYMSTVSTNPATLFGFGTWEAMPAGRVLLAQGKSSWGTTYNAGSTGGEATHRLTVGELPAHNHSASTNTTGAHTHTYTWRNTQGWAGSKSATSVWENTATNNTGSSGNHSHTVTINNTGNNNAHNNIPPYLAIYMWKRIA